MEITREKIIEIIGKEVGKYVDSDILSDNESLSDQGIDSLDRQTIFLSIEETFDVSISDDEINKLNSINDILVFLTEKKL